MSLSNSKAIDVNNLQVEQVKYVLDLISPTLAYTFNLASKSGMFALGMKKARVSVTYKYGDKSEIHNYRHISVLPGFLKGFEKISCSHLSSFLSQYNVLTDCQFGFRKGHSTETVLLTLNEHLVQNMATGLFYTSGLFIDFSKALDCLDHDILA